MSDEARESRGQPILDNHFCEFPGCGKWGSHGYDVHPTATQWFCYEHRWLGYRQGVAPRSFFEDEAAAIDTIMLDPRAVNAM